MASIKKNYIFNLIYQVVSIAASLVTTPYISRRLGPAGVGTYSFTYSATIYFTIFAAMGTAMYGQREIAYCGADISKRSKVFFEVLFFRCISTGIMLAAFILFARNSGMEAVYLAQGISLAAVALDISWFFMGLEQFRKTSLRSVLVKIMGIALIFFLVKDDGDLVLYCLVMSLPVAIANLSLFPMLKGQIRLSVLRKFRINPFHNFKLILQFFLPTIAIQIYTVLDKTMIGLFTDTAVENGHYEQAEKIVKTALVVITALGAVVVPRISALHTQKDRNGIKRMILRSLRFCVFLAFPLFAGIVLLAPHFSPWFFGGGFDQVPELMTVLAFLFFALGLNNAIGIQYLIPTGKQNVFTATVILGAAINFGMNLVLIPRMYAMGAAIATVTAESVIAAVQFVYVRKVFPFSWVLYMSPKYLISALVMSLLLICIRGSVSPTPPGTATLAIVGASVYAAMLFVLKDAFFMYMLRKGLIALRGILRK